MIQLFLFFIFVYFFHSQYLFEFHGAHYFSYQSRIFCLFFFSMIFLHCYWLSNVFPCSKYWTKSQRRFLLLFWYHLLLEIFRLKFLIFYSMTLIFCSKTLISFLIYHWIFVLEQNQFKSGCFFYFHFFGSYFDFYLFGSHCQFLLLIKLWKSCSGGFHLLLSCSQSYKLNYFSKKHPCNHFQSDPSNKCFATFWKHSSLFSNFYIWSQERLLYFLWCYFS